MSRETKDITIRISDLFAAFLRCFKPILCFVLVLTLLGAFIGLPKRTESAEESVVIDPEAIAAEIEAATESVERAKEAELEAEDALNHLLDFEIPAGEKEVARLENVADGWIKFMNDSIYQNMDPFHAGVSRVTMLFEEEVPSVTSENSEKSDYEAFVQAVLTDSDVLNQVRQIMNIDRDLVHVSDLLAYASLSDHIVQIRAFHGDAEIAKQVTDYLVKEIQKRADQSNSGYSIEVIGQYAGYNVEWRVITSQEAYSEKVLSVQADYQQALLDYQALQDKTELAAQTVEEEKANVEQAELSLQELQDRLSGNDQEIIAADEDASPNRGDVLKNVVRNAALFFVIGLFLSCAFVFLYMIFSGKLQNVNSALTRYSFPVIGIIPSKEKRAFDKTIRKLEGEPDLDYATAGRTTAQSLLSVIGERKVALVSTEGDSIQKLTSFTGESVPVCGNLLREVDAVKSAAKFDGFVLVEAKGKSRIDLIDAEIRRIKMLGKEVEGMILL